MALITKIRERSGLAVTFVALAMILFIVGGDLLSGQSKLISIFGGNSDDLGSINGHTVTIKEYQGEIDRIEAEFNLNQNKIKHIKIKQIKIKSLIVKQKNHIHAKLNRYSKTIFFFI